MRAGMIKKNETHLPGRLNPRRWTNGEKPGALFDLSELLRQLSHVPKSAAAIAPAIAAIAPTYTNTTTKHGKFLISPSSSFF